MSKQLTDNRAHDGALRLIDWTVLRARGADATAFLQSQLTQDMLALGPGQVRLAGYCSPKGRLLASLLAWRMDAEEWGLLCSTDLAPAVIKRLSMYVLRARCRLDDASADWVVFGAAGPSIARRMDGVAVAPWRVERRGATWMLGLPEVEGVPRALQIQPPSSPPPEAPALSNETWQWLEVSSGVPRITSATVEQFVPQMVNLELVGGVNFQKGCYPGQEVVARSQYRGTLKRRMHLFATEGSVQAGQEIFHSADAAQPAGRVVNAATHSALGSRLLAEVKIAALESGSLHLGAPDGAALHRLSLPYSVSDTATA